MAGGIWLIGEAKGDALARVSGELATLARSMGSTRGLAVTAVVAGASPAGLAHQLAVYAPRVLTVDVPEASESVWSASVAPPLAALIEREQPSWVLLGATPDGRDLAGMLSVLLGWGVLTSATSVAWGASGPEVEMSVFGGQLITTSELTADHGLLTVRPGSATAEPLPQPGTVESVAIPTSITLPAATVVERVPAVSAAIPVEDAKIVVTGGRGVGGPDGFRIVQELADALGGAVGATRAAVDAGWIDYSQQIGQTGKTVKPSLYVGLGLSGAIQHTVGIQGGCTVVAVTKDAEARITEFADVVVVGDLFQVAPAMVAELRARSG